MIIIAFLNTLEVFKAKFHFHFETKIALQVQVSLQKHARTYETADLFENVFEIAWL